MTLTREIYQKRTYDVRGFMQDSARLCRSFLSLPPDRSNSERLNSAFAERIMLAVTQVNQCRYCEYGHSIAALRAGLTKQELQAIKSGDFNTVPSDELPALVFAQHYAARRGAPEEEAIRALFEAYEEPKSRRILLTIRMITIGNMLGNTFDALLERLRGKPVASGHAIGEISVLLLVVISIPVIAITALIGTILRLRAPLSVSA